MLLLKSNVDIENISDRAVDVWAFGGGAVDAWENTLHSDGKEIQSVPGKCVRPNVLCPFFYPNIQILAFFKKYKNV